MIQRLLWHSTVFLTGLACPAAAQNDPVKIGAIPYSLNWQNKAVNYSAAANSLVITAGPKTDMFRDPNATYNTDNAPRLLFHPDPDFVLSCSIEQGFFSKWDGGALVLWADSLNWIKFCFEKDYTGARRVVSVVTRDISDDCNGVQLTGNKVYYKIAKADDVITLYYSADGKKWFLVRHLRFPFGAGLKAGFLAQSPEGENCRVKFGDIKYLPVKISDPYLGQ